MTPPDNVVTVKLRDFTTTPGPRLRVMGVFSGEEFREDYLIPALNKAKEEGKSLLVDLDGTSPVSEGFLSEAFGDIASVASPTQLLLKSDERPDLKSTILNIVVARIRGERDKKLLDKLAENQQITANLKKSNRRRKS